MLTKWAIGDLDLLILRILPGFNLLINLQCMCVCERERMTEVFYGGGAVDKPHLFPLS